MSVPAFTNSPINSDALPTVENLTFRPLAPPYKTAMYVERLVTSAIMVAIAIGIGLFAGLPSALSFGLVTLGAVAAIVWLATVPVTFKHKGWLVRQHDISTRTGVLTRRLSTVPFIRVQNVAVRQSFLDRVFDVASLDVFTAGSDLHIVGLAPIDAERLRLLVLERAGVGTDAAGESSTAR